jgi:hypothetical protein
VEVAVQNVERCIIARMRHQKFFNLFELNKAIRILLDELNNRQMEHLGKSHRELFELYDRPALKPLPVTPYEFAIWKKARISIDYHVEYDKHYYSVPHHLYPGDVDIRANEIHSYKGIKNILVNQLNQPASTEDTPQPSLLPPHSNIRGKDYYN